MSTPADDHTEEEVQIDENSMHDSESQILDDDNCDSENSFGSYLSNNAMDENMTADIELDSYLPVYSDEEYPQSTSIQDDMYLLTSPSVVPQYTPPTRSLTSQPTSNAKFSGPSMCVVRGLILNPAQH